MQAEVLSTRAGIMAMERQLAKVEQRQAKTKAASDAQVASLRDEVGGDGGVVAASRMHLHVLSLQLAAQREQALAVQKELRGVTSVRCHRLSVGHFGCSLRAHQQEYDELVARHPVADLRAETQLLQHELLTLGYVSFGHSCVHTHSPTNATTATACSSDALVDRLQQ